MMAAVFARAFWLSVALALSSLAPCAAQAEAPRTTQTDEGSAKPSNAFDARHVGWTTLGVFSAFLAHEGGHLAMNLLFGNVPTFDGFLYGGFIPFFAIAPNIDCYGEHCVRRDGHAFHGGRPGKYLIVTGGFHVQHLTDELLLTRDPELRAHDAPFHKGMLLFNVFLSCFYAAGYFTGLEDPHGDLNGAASASQIHEAYLATLLLVPAALDTYRYFRPHDRVVPWVSRAAKAGFLGIAFTL